MENTTTSMYIKLYDSLMTSPIWDENSNVLKTFITILLSADKYDKDKYKSGHCYVAKEELAKRANIAYNTFDKSLDKLVELDMVNVKILKKDGKHFGTEIIIKNWGKFQSFSQNSEKVTSVTNYNTEGYKVNTSNFEVRNEVGFEVGFEDIKERINKDNKDNISTTTSSQNLKENENSFINKNYFLLDNVLSFIKNNYNINIDDTVLSFIKNKYVFIESNSFTKKSGENWDVISFSNWVIVLLNKNGYNFTKKSVNTSSVNNNELKSDSTSTSTNKVIPFTKEELLSKLKNEDKRVTDELLKRYDYFAKNDFISKSGNQITLSFMTSTLLNDLYKQMNITRNSLRNEDYANVSSANFWDNL